MSMPTSHPGAMSASSAENLFTDSRQWLTEAENLAGIGSWIYDPRTGKEHWSAGLRDLLSVSPNDPSPILFEFIPGLEQAVSAFLSSKTPFVRRKFVLRTFNDTLVLLFQAEKRFDSDGRVTHLIGALQNISDIVWTFGIPGMGDQLLQTVVSCEDVLVIAIDNEMRPTYIEGEGWDKLGIIPDALVGRPLSELLKNYPHVVKHYAEALRGKAQNVYISLGDRHYAAKLRPLYGPEGNIIGAIGFAIDITDRHVIQKELELGAKVLEETVRQRTMELKVSETTLQSVLDASNVAIAIFDPECRLRYANAVAHRILGVPEGALFDRFIGDFLEPEMLEILMSRKMEHCGEPRSVKHFRRQLSLRREDQSLIWVDANAALVCDDEGRPAQMIVVLFDVTDQLRHLEELEHAKSLSESASVAKSQFLAHMSHEIRTPLNGVIGLSDLLMGTGLSPKQQEYVGLINISGKSLLFLINDILDFSKIEAGKMEIENEEFDLLTTVESVLGILATRASDKGLELCGSFSSDIPRFVQGDSGRLRQVLINLVGNALKFTIEGGVKVQVAADRVTLSSSPCDNDSMNDEVVLRFSVTDTGIGIPPEKLSKLFQSFSQIDNTASKKHDGSGLGLAISKRLVELMGGDLHVESIEGEGSVFWFTLPFRCRSEIRDCPALYGDDLPAGKSCFCPRTGLQECPQGRRHVTHGSVPLSDRSAIVVDDNEVQREALTEQLSSWGMDVTAVASKKEAMDCLLVAAAAGRPFQLAIIDSSIEDGEGMDLVDAMKVDKRLKETAIILLTPLTVDTDIAVIHSAGVSMHVSKPVFSSSLFDATITALFSRDKARNAESPNAADEETASIVAEGYDERRSLVRILVAEDNRINQIVVRDTLEGVGFQCHIVDHGGMAVEALRNDKSFDVVLMDCQMPEMDGFEATARIRENELADMQAGGILKRIPIIALTANATKDDEARCLNSGMDAYCSKPINPKALVRTIDLWIKPILQRRIEQNPEESAVPFSIKMFYSLCGKNKLIATMVLSDFLNQVPKDLDTVETTMGEGDWDRAAVTLRHLRGKAGLLGATNLENAADALERRCMTSEGEDPDRLMDVLFDEANRCIQYAAMAKEKILNDAVTLK